MRGTVRSGDLHPVCAVELRPSLNVIDFSLFAELSKATGQRIDDAVLPRPCFRHVDPRLSEVDTPVLGLPRFGDDLGEVQKRLRWDAAPVEAHTTGIGLGVDERNMHPEIRRQKRSRVTAWTCADYNDLRVVRLRHCTLRWVRCGSRATRYK